MTELIFSILALAAGPILFGACRKHAGPLAALDGFIYVSMGGLILIDVLPPAIELGGWLCFVFAFAGLVGPTILERSFRGASRQMHLFALGMGLLALGLHALVDGVYLGGAEGQESAQAHGHSHGHSHDHAMSGLPLAIILHRLPVGLTVWWLCSGRGTSKHVFRALAMLSGIAICTIVGFSFGRHFLEDIEQQYMAWFQAFVGGSLLHVVIHRPHDEDGTCVCGPENTSPSHRLWEGFGGVLGLALVIPFLPDNGEVLHGHAHDGFVARLFDLVLESAPALLLGFGMAGLIAVFLPASSVRWLSKGKPLTQAGRGVVLGLPLPVCSCGVVPLYRTLVERGAPATAAIAFLVATPEIGIDAVLLSLPLLGVEFTMTRVIAAFALALVVGVITGSFAKKIFDKPADGSCCKSIQEHAQNATTFRAKLRSAIGIGFFELVDRTGPWIVFGLIIAALAAPFVDESGLTSVHPVLQVVLFAALGIPVYVCAAGATPLVAVLLLQGVSPGAALAFLLTGPATNLVTLGILRSLHGRAVAIVFAVSMLGLSIGLGLLANLTFDQLELASSGTIGHDHVAPWRLACAIALGVVFLISFVRCGPRQFVSDIAPGLAAHPSAHDDESDHGHSHDHDHDHDHSHGHH